MIRKIWTKVEGSICAIRGSKPDILLEIAFSGSNAVEQAWLRLPAAWRDAQPDTRKFVCRHTRRANSERTTEMVRTFDWIKKSRKCFLNSPICPDKRKSPSTNCSASCLQETTQNKNKTTSCGIIARWEKTWLSLPSITFCCCKTVPRNPSHHLVPNREKQCSGHATRLCVTRQQLY